MNIIPILLIPKNLTYKVKQVPGTQFLGSLVFSPRKELDNKQQIIDILLQQISENNKLVCQVEYTTL